MKKKILSMLMLTAVLSLAACNTTPSDSSSTTSSSSSSSSSTSVDDSNYVKNDDLERGITTYQDEKGVEHPLNANTLYTNQGSPHLESIGSANVLVVPVAFKQDTSDSRWINPTEDLHDKIELTFQGSDEEVKANGGQISVESFYQKSSYGKSNFSCTVTPWMQLDYTPSEYRYNYCNNANAGANAARLAKAWYNEEYSKLIKGEESDLDDSFKDKPLSYYDSNNDGYIDLVWLVYAYPQDTNDTDFWWAYVTYTGNSANKLDPSVQTLGWASTAFMEGGIDSHTFIHETGHTLGADDYYDYNKKWSPMGGIDYMDQNLGDHNAFTKFQYGWVNPWILKEEDLADGKKARITLRAFTNTGDALVLASPNYNGTAFDEYLILELVGPTGLAEHDYISGFNSIKGFDKPGIRVIHVDARTYKDSTTWYTDVNELGQKAKVWKNENSYGGRNSPSEYFPHLDNFGKIDNTSKFCLAHVIENGFDKTSTVVTPGVGSKVINTSALFRKNSYLDLSMSWGQYFMPSRSNLWNKALTRTGSGEKDYKIDDTMTCDYVMSVVDIVEDDEYGYVATIDVELA